MKGAVIKQNPEEDSDGRDCAAVTDDEDEGDDMYAVLNRRDPKQAQAEKELREIARNEAREERAWLQPMVLLPVPCLLQVATVLSFKDPERYHHRPFIE